MNATIIHKAQVKDAVMDNLAMALPGIIADALELPGGKLAIVKPEQVSLEFSQASSRDVGSDIKIMVFARNLPPRLRREKDLAKEILEKVVMLASKPGDEHSIDIRIYLMEVGVAEHVPST
jgi:hypothetical protein